MKFLTTTLFALVSTLVAAQEVFEGIEPAKTLKPIGDHNPVNIMKYSADPGVMVYDDTIYVYGTNDAIAAELGDNPSDNNYDNIHSINVMSSKDLVNWVDHGTIIGATEEGAAKWANWSWAPAATHKVIDGKEKFFLYFANSGNGIGVLTSDSPTGPFVDPLGKELVSFDSPNCKDIVWLFDPAVFVDDDGTGYLYFGGGIPDNIQDPKNATNYLPNYPSPKTIRAAKLGDDMISLASEPVVIDAPYAFEDSGMHKAGDTYYYTYCTNWDENSPFNQARIGYMTSENPLGPFTFQDTLFNNPGDFFKDGDYRIDGNNHHTVVQFHDKWYIFYHSEWFDYITYGKKLGYRTTHVDYLPFEDGKFLNATGTLKGVEQLFNVNPYTEQPAALTAWSAGTSTNGLGHTTLTYNKGEWTGVSNVDFEDGAYAIIMTASSEKGAVIKITVDDVDGEVIGYVAVPASTELETIVAEITPVAGVKHLFFMASDDVTVDTWEFVRNGEEIPTDVSDETQGLEDDVDSNDESNNEEEPKEEEGNNEEPKEEEGNNEEPKEEEGNNEEPKEEEGNNEEPKEEEGNNEEPKEEEGNNEEPKDELKDDENSEPDNDNAEPTEGNNEEPKQEEGNNEEPKQEEGNNEEPKDELKDDENSEPDNDNAEPTEGENDNAEPTEGENDNAEPTEGENDNAEPTEGENDNGEGSEPDDNNDGNEPEPTEGNNDENEPPKEDEGEEEEKKVRKCVVRKKKPEEDANDNGEESEKPEEEANNNGEPEDANNDNGEESEKNDEPNEGAENENEPTEAGDNENEPTDAGDIEEKNEDSEKDDENEPTEKPEEKNEEPPKDDAETEEPPKEDANTEEPPKEDGDNEEPPKEDGDNEEPPKEDANTEEPPKDEEGENNEESENNEQLEDEEDSNNEE